MAATPETGNPVFDYRASFRRRAAAAQSLLIGFGLFGFVVAGTLWIATTAVPCRWSGSAALAGLLSVIAGLIWGFYWRNKMRGEFQQKFKTDVPQR
jgi:hypothetical protein